jgi:hypothetical protein
MQAFQRALGGCANGDLLAGDVPNRVLSEARRWIEEHQAELLELWDEFQR